MSYLIPNLNDATNENLHEAFVALMSVSIQHGLRRQDLEATVRAWGQGLTTACAFFKQKAPAEEAIKIKRYLKEVLDESYTCSDEIAEGFKLMVTKKWKKN